MFAETLRVDYVHSGGPGGEALTLDRAVADGPWPGSQTQLIDSTNLGTYFFEVIDHQDRPIYSRGFSSIYAEWATTPEMRTNTRTFHESVRFPWPTAPVRIIFKKRDAQNVFQPLWSVEIDPKSISATPGEAAAAGAVWPIVESGPASVKVDLLLIGEGYNTEQLPKFHADAARLVKALFAVEPFATRKTAFNVRALDLPSRSLSVERNVFGLQRYVISYDNRSLRAVSALAPSDVAAILVNEEQYGGGGIFNQQSTVAAGNQAAEYIFVHEFAHNFAGLGDEYVGNVTYETGTPVKAEPWEPNVTALLDPAGLKWRDLVEPGTPLPTPPGTRGKVGAFEGAGYQAKGLYRGEADCIMFSRNPVGFCRVCQRAISRMIDTYTR